MLKTKLKKHFNSDSSLNKSFTSSQETASNTVRFETRFKQAVLSNKKIINFVSQSNLAKDDEQLADPKVFVVQHLKAEKSLNDMVKYFVDLHLTDVLYTQNTTRQVQFKFLKLTDLIKDRMKSFYTSRYKILVNCTFGERKQHGVTIASKCLWDNTKDVCHSVEILKNNFFILVTVFAVYVE